MWANVHGLLLTHCIPVLRPLPYLRQFSLILTFRFLGVSPIHRSKNENDWNRPPKRFCFSKKTKEQESYIFNLKVAFSCAEFYQQTNRNWLLVISWCQPWHKLQEERQKKVPSLHNSWNRTPSCLSATVSSVAEAEHLTNDADKVLAKGDFQV